MNGERGAGAHVGRSSLTDQQEKPRLNFTNDSRQHERPPWSVAIARWRDRLAGRPPTFTLAYTYSTAAAIIPRPPIIRNVLFWPETPLHSPLKPG